MTGWSWDPTLYAGSARWYPRGRVPYPAALVDALVAELGLDGTGRLLDLGCGPGSLTLPLAPWFAATTAVDADADMLAEGARLAAELGVAGIAWVHRRAEELDAEEVDGGAGRFRLVTLAQSFHWMDRPRVAATARGLLGADGALAHVHATTHEGLPGTHELGHPRPPRDAIGDLVRDWLGPDPRAGARTRPLAAGTAGAARAAGTATVAGPDTGAEDERGRVEDGIYRAAGFTDRTRLVVPGRVVRRTADEVVASVFSLSSAAPHLFGDRVGGFEAQLRALLARAAPDGVFAEQLREVAVDVWR